MNIQYAGGAFFLLWMVSAWTVGSLIKLTGSDLWIFRGALSAMGVTSYAVFYWWLNKRQAAKAQREAAASGAAPAAGEGGAGEVDLLVREADKRLAQSRLAQDAKLGNLPVIFLLGEPASTKTTTMVKCGLDAELLAGHIYQENNIIPTRAANIWFARGAVFTEAGGGLLASPASWTRLVKKLQPGKVRSVFGKGGQAPRAALVCFDSEHFVRSSTDQLAVAARNLQARLGEVSQTLGISFPVYVLFTRMDRLPFFAEYVRNLSNEEAGQVLGVTLPVRATHGAGVYAEEETQRLNSAFNQLFYSLCDHRIDFLGREHDPEKLPAAYEFPREFRKTRSGIVQFLVDVCRPSQLRANPFLRGFYFAGVRAIFISDSGSLAASTPRPIERQPSETGATGIFKVGGAQAAAPPPAMIQPPGTVTRKIPQWLFLSHLFNDVILQDRAAMGASGASTKTSLLRRVLLAAAGALFLLCSIGFIVSYFGNRALIGEAREAAQAAPGADLGAGGVASVDSLKRLETLRQTLEKLTIYEREGPPLRLRWFLYAGSDMYPYVRSIYYSRFHQLLFGQTQAGILAYLQRLPAAPGPADEYEPPYNALKAYLITTSHHEKSTRLFLSPYLHGRWTSGRDIDPERRGLAQKQFDFYSEDLKIANPYSSENDGAAVDRARRYLAQFSGLERIYQSMLADASSKKPSVNFNRDFKGSAEVLINNKDVAGAFSRDGWAFMMDAIKRADQYYGGEKWVLGDYAAAAVDRAGLEKELFTRYTTDFIAQWRAYIKGSIVVGYANLRDAAAKLNKTSSNQSPLLAMFWLASLHTGVDNAKVREAFDAVHKVTPPSTVMQFVGPTNTNYITSLAALQAGIEQAASQPSGPDPGMAAQTLQQAMSARLAVRQIAQAFRIDAEAHLEAATQKLLEDPITHAERLLRGVGPAELNQKARMLCAGFTMTNKFPFNPMAQTEATLQELSAIFKPREGSLWMFYESSLKNVLQKQGSQYVAVSSGGISLNPQFVYFFNQAARFSEALYPAGAADPSFRYSLRLIGPEYIQSITYSIDGERGVMTAQTPPKQFVWPGRGAQEVKLVAKFTGGLDWDAQDRQGLWAVFRFFADADQFSQAGTGYRLTWVGRVGRENRPMILGGKQATFSLMADAGGAPLIFLKDFLASLRCVSQAAR